LQGDWSSDVCSSDLVEAVLLAELAARGRELAAASARRLVLGDLESDPLPLVVRLEPGERLVDLPASRVLEPAVDRRAVVRDVEQIGRASCRGSVWSG